MNHPSLLFQMQHCGFVKPVINSSKPSLDWTNTFEFCTKTSKVTHATNVANVLVIRKLLRLTLHKCMKIQEPSSATFVIKHFLWNQCSTNTFQPSMRKPTDLNVTFVGRIFQENIAIKYISELCMNNPNLILVSIVEALMVKWVICIDMYGKYMAWSQWKFEIDFSANLNIWLYFSKSWITKSKT